MCVCVDKTGGRGAGGHVLNAQDSAFLPLQGLEELVGIFSGLDPEEEGHGAGGVFVVDRGVGDTNHHNVVLPHTRARHGRLHEDVQQDVSYRGKTSH